MHNYLVIFEQGKDGGWGAYAPDLPGLGVAAESREEAASLVREGIRLYLEELREEGLPAPDSASIPEIISIAA